MHWLLVSNADSIPLNKAASDMNRASLGADELPDAFAARLWDLGDACGNVYGDDRLKIAFIQGLLNHLQVDAQQYNLQFTEHTLQQLASFTQGKHEQVKALQRLEPTPPRCTWNDRPVGQDPRRRFWPQVSPRRRPAVVWRAGASLSRPLRPVTHGGGNVRTG